MRGQLAETGKPWNFKNRAAHKRTWSIFRNMHTRCSNPNAVNWKYYGGAGITVCSEWRMFDQFLSDMGDAPDGLELDRIESMGPYCKSNCRWVDHFMQNSTQRNRRKFISTEQEHIIRSNAQRKHAATISPEIRHLRAVHAVSFRHNIKHGAR